MTNHRSPSLLLSALVILFCALAQAGFTAAQPGVSPDDAKNIMPVSQIKRGMRGYGLTVFQGTKIEKFDVEILGILKQMNTGKDLILIRAGGGPITSRATGIISGMSGSPVYINGKIIGAVSYGGAFSKEPVGMVTPIADMLEAWDSNLPKTASGYSSPQVLSDPVMVDGKSADRIVIDRPGEKTEGVSNGILHMQPLMTPLMVSGLSQRGITKLSEILQPFGLQPMAGPGGTYDSNIKADLVPGAAIGMSLARGDIDITAVGTVTYRRGNKVVAFGHPMMSIGAIDAPMTTAYVNDVLSSYNISTKLASPIKMVGRIFQDRPWSIAGAIGDMPSTIPAVININDETSRRTKTFKVNVTNHPLLASRVLTMVVGEAMSEVHPTPGDTTAEVSYEVNADKIGKIKRSNVFFDNTDIGSSAISDIGNMLQMLGSNKFHPIDIKSLTVNVRMVDRRDTATIDRIFVKKSEYEPGENVEVGVVLRPYKKERVTKTFNIKIPATVPDGKIVLQVRGGASPAGLSAAGDGEPGAMLMMALGGNSDIAGADNVQQMVDKYLEREKNNEIVVKLQMRNTAINVTGEKLSGLPGAIADVMKSSRNSGLKLEKEEVKQSFDAGTITYGAAQLSINVKRKDMKEGKSSPRTIESISSDSMDPSDHSSDSSASSYEEITAISMSTQVSLTDKGSNLIGLSQVQETTSDESTMSDSLGISDDESAQPKEEIPSVTNAVSNLAKSDIKTVVRQPKVWSQKDQAGFAKGTFYGISASSKNKLELVPTIKKMAETPEQYVWSVAPANDGGVYAGTGNSGIIYHVAENGEIKPFYETGELEVHALVRDKSGNIYAATSPRGKVFKISPSGKGELLFSTDERYAMTLAIDNDNNLYVGVGDAGKIYKVQPDGKASVFAKLNEQQVLSLYWDNRGYLLAGTGINGVLYKIEKTGSASPVFNADEDSITSVISDSQGNIYAGTSPKGGIYKITPDHRFKKVVSKAVAPLSLAVDSRNNIYAVSDGSLIKIMPDDTVTYLDSSKEKTQFLSLAFSDKNDTLYAGTGNIGSVYVSRCCDIEGNYESPVHDAGMVSKWGRIKWIADTPEGTTLEVKTRVGNVATPDNTWSEWSASYSQGSGEQINAANARYIQYKVTMKTRKADVSPSVSVISISYMTPNQAPTVKLTSPDGTEVWAGKKTIKWTGSDPDKDSLTYEVYCSADGGKNWESLSSGINKPSASKTATDAEITAKIKNELDKSKDVPENMKKAVLKDQPKEMNAPAAGRSVTPEGSSAKTSYTWDTTGVKDGTYIVKVVVSDKPSNATNALTAEAISEPFTVCNTGPKVTVYRSEITVKSVGTVTINGLATGNLAAIAGVQYRVDGGDWASAAAKDEIFDSSMESFTVITDNLSAGSHKIEIQAVDAAGNASSETVEVKVS